VKEASRALCIHSEAYAGRGKIDCDIGWIRQNRANFKTHDMSRMDWKHYKHLLLKNVCDIYVQYWKNVELTSGDIKMLLAHYNFHIL